MHLTSLPDGALHCMSSFLPLVERALFCISLSGSSCIESILERRAIFQNDFMSVDELNFEDVNSELASRLADTDLSKILILIGVGNLTQLKLKNCTGIIGQGLEPLRGSTVLKHLDLSIISNKSATIDVQPTLCVEVVAPIVDSILERRENVGLLSIKFPKKWEEGQSETFVGLKERYGQFFIRGLTHC